MHFPTQGQWWSNPTTHRLHIEQWWVLSGLSIWQVRHIIGFTIVPTLWMDWEDIWDNLDFDLSSFNTGTWGISAYPGSEPHIIHHKKKNDIIEKIIVIPVRNIREWYWIAATERIIGGIEEINNTEYPLNFWYGGTGCIILHIGKYKLSKCDSKYMHKLVQNNIYLIIGV